MTACVSSLVVAWRAHDRRVSEIAHTHHCSELEQPGPFLSHRSAKPACLPYSSDLNTPLYPPFSTFASHKPIDEILRPPSARPSIFSATLRSATARTSNSIDLNEVAAWTTARLPGLQITPRLPGRIRPITKQFSPPAALLALSSSFHHNTKNDRSHY